MAHLTPFWTKSQGSTGSQETGGHNTRTTSILVKQCKSWSQCSERNSVIRVCTVCHLLASFARLFLDYSNKWRHSNLGEFMVNANFEPAQEIMVLFSLRKLILQTRIRSHPVGLDVWFFVRCFVYFHSSCVRTAKALTRLRRLTWAFAGRLCDKYHNLMSWLIWL